MHVSTDNSTTRATIHHGFTLVELLVVVVIIIILVAVLVPGLKMGMAAARMASCSANERLIAGSVISYRKEHKGINAPHRNEGLWFPYYDDPTPPVVTEEPNADGVIMDASREIQPYQGDPTGYKEGSKYIDPDHVWSYWGVRYLEGTGHDRNVFQCAEAETGDPWYADESRNNSRSPAIENPFTTYAFNGARSRFSKAGRSPHFEWDSKGWPGAHISNDQNPAMTMIFMDGWETMLDDNGDVPTFRTGNAPDHAWIEYWRHGGSGNYAFNDMHVENVRPETTDPKAIRKSTVLRKYWYFQNR